MSIATLYQFYGGYKTARSEISKVKDSGALKVLSLSYQVDMLVVEYAKLKPAVKLGMADKPVEAISVKLRVIVNDLQALIDKTPPLPSIGKDMTEEYVTGLLDTSNIQRLATNELQRIYMEQFNGALPAAAGGKAYWPDKKRSLLRLKEAASAAATSLRGSAYSFERDIKIMVDGQSTLRDIRGDRTSTADDVNEMDKDFRRLRDGETETKRRQARYYAVSDFFQGKADRFAQLIEAGDALWVKGK